MRIPFALPLAALILATACQQQESNQTASLNTSIPEGAPDRAGNAAASNETEDSSSSGSGGWSGSSGAAPSRPAARAETAVTSRDAIPPAFIGRWTGIEIGCGDRSSDLRLSITAKEMRFYESVGTVTSVEGAGQSAIMVDASYEGEGQTWTRKIKMALSADQSLLTITADGRAVTRKRCSTTP